VIGVAAVVFVAITGTQAAANTISFQIVVDHCTGNCGPQTSFGTVTITDVASNQVSVDVTLLNNNKFVNTGLPAFGFNLNGISTFTFSGLTSNFAFENMTSGTVTANTIGDDGFGDFDFAVDYTGGSGGSNPAAGPLDFTLTATGLSTASFMKLSSGGHPSAYFGVDILSGTTGKTGPVGVICGPGECVTITPFTTVPEPASFLLLGSGLLAAAAVVRRRPRARSK
jgi:hypothetical protein